MEKKQQQQQQQQLNIDLPPSLSDLHSDQHQCSVMPVTQDHFYRTFCVVYILFVDLTAWHCGVIVSLPDSLADFHHNRVQVLWRLCRVLPGNQVEHCHWHLHHDMIITTLNIWQNHLAYCEAKRHESCHPNRLHLQDSVETRSLPGTKISDL